MEAQVYELKALGLVSLNPKRFESPGVSRFGARRDMEHHLSKE